MWTTDEVLKLEAERIMVRRVEAVRKGLLDAGWSGEIAGLALSGGGIRAGFVARGFIEVLAERHKLARFDYMSSVSGGGYAAGMLTDHIGNSGNPAEFDKDIYKLEAPVFNWPRIGAGLLLDLVFNLGPVIAYFCLIPLLLSGSKSVAGAFLIMGPASLMLAGLWATAFFYLRLYGAGRFAATMGRWKWVSMILLCFLLSTTVTVLLLAPALLRPVLPGSLSTTAAVLLLGPILFCPILIGMWASEAFVSARPHRYHKSANPAFRWLFIAFLGVIAGVFGYLLSHVSWAVPILFLLTALSFVSTSMPLPRYNEWNLIFTAYRTAIVGRFLPCSALTAGGELYATVQGWNPYPIMNAAVATGHRLEPFELAPLYSGSEPTGFHLTQTWLPHLRLGDAMAISGGAVDFLRKTATMGSILGTLFGGTEYWVSSTGKPAGAALITIKRMEVAVGSAQGTAVRLSDGGFVDNLGVLALVKRRVKLVVCLDASYDPNYEFEDLRRLCIQLQADGLALLSIQDIGRAMAERRFRQNTSNLLCGTLTYPATANHSEERGLYLHLKISAAQLPLQPRYADFPHLTTLDQLLHADEIAALHALGRQLGAELCDDPLFS